MKRKKNSTKEGRRVNFEIDGNCFFLVSTRLFPASFLLYRHDFSTWYVKQTPCFYHISLRISDANRPNPVGLGMQRRPFRVNFCRRGRCCEIVILEAAVWKNLDKKEFFLLVPALPLSNDTIQQHLPDVFSAGTKAKLSIYLSTRRCLLVSCHEWIPRCHFSSISTHPTFDTDRNPTTSIQQQPYFATFDLDHQRPRVPVFFHDLFNGQHSQCHVWGTQYVG